MSGYLLAGFLLGAILIVVHVWLARRRGKRPALEAAVILMLSALSISAGAKVIVICVTADSLKPFAEEDRVYIALGGIALLWVSVASIPAALALKDD